MEGFLVDFICDACQEAIEVDLMGIDETPWMQPCPHCGQWLEMDYGILANVKVIPTPEGELKNQGMA